MKNLTQPALSAKSKDKSPSVASPKTKKGEQLENLGKHGQLGQTGEPKQTDQSRQANQVSQANQLKSTKLKDATNFNTSAKNILPSNNFSATEQSLNGCFSLFNEAQRRELWASLALKHTQGLGQRSATTLLHAYGSPYKAVCQVENWHKHGISPLIITEFKREDWRQAAGTEWANLKIPIRLNASGEAVQQNILLWTSPYYPEHLKNTPSAPIFLYYMGDISLLSNPGVGVVGARAASSDGLAASSRASSELSKSGVTVISGLATGVDREAHCAALKGPGSTIAVLGCGLDVYYPKENIALQQHIARQGLLLTEYSAGTKPESFHFPVRNRIISALALGVLVVEAAGRSGSLITARLALEYGREVFAIPGKYAASKAQGCHDLIRRGAKPVLDIEDLILELLPKLEAYANFGKEILLKEKEAVTQKSNTAKVKTAGQASKATKKLLAAPKNPKPVNETIPLREQPYLARPNDQDNLDQSILNLLELHGPLQVDSICALLQTSAGKISSKLLCMELEGLVKRYPGMIYALQ